MTATQQADLRIIVYAPALGDEDDRSVAIAHGMESALPGLNLGWMSSDEGQRIQAVDGKTMCENCGEETVPGQKHQKGVTPPSNETQVDHKIPRAKGGPGDPENGQVLCRECNIEKSDKEP